MLITELNQGRLKAEHHLFCRSGHLQQEIYALLRKHGAKTAEELKAEGE